jgi:putative ABC transport system permease protein
MTAGVGALGLSSAVAVSVMERTRELGVLKAMGASGSQVRNVVLAEGLLVGGLSLALAGVLGLALAWGLGAAIGRMSFALPLPLTPSYAAAIGWALAVIVLSALASALPAMRAARLTVREAVNHV